MNRNVKPNSKAKPSSNSKAFKAKRKFKSDNAKPGSVKDVVLASTSANLNSKDYSNDPNWYFSSPELAQQAAELSFQSFIGQGEAFNGYKIPAVMTIAMSPSPGLTYFIDDPGAAQASSVTNYEPGPSSLDTNNGLNMMANKIYTLLSTYSGRTSLYGPQDVGMMLCAIASVAEMSEHIRRVFGLALTYNQRNRFVPNNLINSLGVSAGDLFQNISNYRMRFNIEINRINQIPLLDNVGFIKKCRDIYQNVYLDNLSSMAQLFAYVPATYWVLDETTYSSGSALVSYNTPFIANNPTHIKMSLWIDHLSTQITALLQSTTLNVIYADLINLASKLNVPFWRFDYLAENYVVMPIFDRTAILQVHNLEIAGAPTDHPFGSGAETYEVAPGSFVYTEGNSVFQDPNRNILLYNPVFPIGSNATGADSNYVVPESIVDMDTDQPTLEDRIESMRLKTIESHYYITPSATKWATFKALPDHYVTQINIRTTNGPAIDNLYFTGSHIKMNAGSNPASSLEKATALSQFANHPLLRYDSSATDSKILGDLGFFTKVDYSYLSRLNRLISTGLFEFRAGK